MTDATPLASEQITQDSWKQAIIDALVVSHIYRAEHETDPRKALHDLICWEADVALDPAVSARAAALSKVGPDAERLQKIATGIETQADCLEGYAESHGFSGKAPASVFHWQATHFRDLAGELRAALSATPAPSDQDASQAQGEVEIMPACDERRLWDDAAPDGYRESDIEWLDRNWEVARWLVNNHAAIRARLASPAPGATAQDGAHRDLARPGKIDPCEYCFGVTRHDADCRVVKKPTTPTPTIPAGMVADDEGHRWSFNADTRDIEFGASPVFKVYEASDFPCLEDDERAEADDWYDAQAQTTVLMLNSLLHDQAAAPAPKQAEQQGVERVDTRAEQIDRETEADMAAPFRNHRLTLTPTVLARTITVPECPTDEMLEASAIEWTRLCHGYPPEDGHYRFMRSLWSAMLEAVPAALNAPTGAVEKERG